MLHVDSELEKQINEQAALFHLTPEQFLKESVKSRQKQLLAKEALLREGKEFQHFLKTYTKLIDDLFYIEPHIKQVIVQRNMSPAMENVFEAIGEYIANNPEFLLYLYTVYKDIDAPWEDTVK